MSFTPTSPITGSAQAGLTNPTYTHVSDIAPDVNAKQYAVTALGGTQTGVVVNSVARPFTLTGFRPKVFKQLGTPNPVTGIISNVGMNIWQVLTRKGVLPAADQPPKTAIYRTYLEVPAGSEAYDAVNLQAGLSAHIGMLTQVSSALGTSVTDATW